MIFHLTRPLVPLAVLALVAAGCAPASSESATAGPRSSDLAPTYTAAPGDSGPRSGPRQVSGKRHERLDRRRHPKASGARPVPSAAGSPGLGTGRADQAKPTPTRTASAASAGPVTVRDPRGDLGPSAQGEPASADIVAVRLSRQGDLVEVRTTFAGEVPRRQTGSKGMNVASFFDVDGNGMVDYEIWASLADNGWGTGYRDDRRNKASFGPDTGIEVSVKGDTLVTRFRDDRIGGADGFRWSAASEWGSYQSMAASTSARDYAPDHGAAAYPG
jgi:hypothetical protein